MNNRSHLAHQTLSQEKENEIDVDDAIVTESIRQRGNASPVSKKTGSATASASDSEKSEGSLSSRWKNQ